LLHELGAQLLDGGGVVGVLRVLRLGLLLLGVLGGLLRKDLGEVLLDGNHRILFE